MQRSVGAHVRDAAAYVCWAFARAYSPEALGATGVVYASFVGLSAVLSLRWALLQDAGAACTAVIQLHC